VVWFEQHLQNPPVRLALLAGLPLPPLALLARAGVLRWRVIAATPGDPVGRLPAAGRVTGMPGPVPDTSTASARIGAGRDGSRRAKASASRGRCAVMASASPTPVRRVWVSEHAVACGTGSW
jgi:hypothetical protein